jgi:hypothetical protein
LPWRRRGARSSAKAFRICAYPSQEAGPCFAIPNFSSISPANGAPTDSGYGREGGTESLECYTVAKTVSHLVL